LTWRADLPEAIARDFWRDAEAVLRPGATAELPKPILAAVAGALPVMTVALPGLSVARAQEWLRGQGIGRQLGGGDWPLRGMVIALRGRALVLYDPEDDAAEVRVTLAHEAAHVICHYLTPRERVLRRLGDGLLPVLDGDRAPSAEEKLGGVLSGCPLGLYSHVMERVGRGGRDRLTRDVEWEADVVALEILAPGADMLRRCAGGFTQPTARRVLEFDFGLPPWAAELHAGILAARLGPPPAVAWARSLRQAEFGPEGTGAGHGA